jgi:hypothetical protein
MKAAKVVVAIFLLLLLAGTSPVFAEDSHHDSHQDISLTLSGAILDSGTQHYSHSGGELVAAMVGGNPILDQSAESHFSLHAVVSGLTVQGSAEFSLEYTDSTGAHVKIHGSAPIGDMIPAEAFPLGCNPAATPTDCLSGIPGVFVGIASVTTHTCQVDIQSQGDGDHSQNGGDDSNNGDNSNTCTKTSDIMAMDFESAFLNPFGGPILMSSIDGSFMIIASYDHARVTWDGIQMGGTVTGQLSGKPVTGTFAQVVSATEDLKAGHESERGTIAFAGMSDPTLNAAGKFSGRSTIPAGVDCGLPMFPPGTCQITGFHSDGHFSQTNGSGERIKGEYDVEWTAPAVMFTGTVTATLK